VTYIHVNDTQELQYKEFIAASLKCHCINATLFKTIIFLQWLK